MKEYAPTEAVLLDIDGTLLDSNDAHARSWVETLAAAGHDVAFARVRPLIGMGSDRLLEALLGLRPDDPDVERLGAARRERFLSHHVASLRPTRGARDLLAFMKSQELTLVVATAASPEELDALLRQAGIADLLDASVTSGDAARTKPAPDTVQAALERAGVDPVEAILIGDTPYDVEAAARAGVDTIALRCGGWDDAALAGAVAVYDDPAALHAQWDGSPIARRRIPGG